MLPPLQKRWVIHEIIPDIVAQELTAYPSFFRQLLYARGVQDASSALRYLDCPVDEDNPFGLKNMGDTVNRIFDAIDHQQAIAVYGDYDVDGVTATTLLVQVLRRYGANVIPYIPNRFEEGYGLNVEAVDSLAAQKIRLIITVDCGIRSPVEAERAKERAVDLIISDHHHPAPELPDAYAIICPKQPGDTYPEKDLSGVGLAYKIAQALELKRPQMEVHAEDWLDLVAVGTVADVAPLTGENRRLVRRGLQAMRLRLAETRPGLFSLANVAGVKLQRVSAGDIGFLIGPRLNAAGRLTTAMDALTLLMAASVDEAGLLSQTLDNQNRERQDLTRRIQEEAARLAQEEAARLAQAGISANILFAFSPTFNSGVVGLACSRLVDQFYRPAVVGEQGESVTHASCRSIPEFHITRALDECKDLLERHGGHALAAGFTIRNENIPAFTQRMGEIADRELAGQPLSPQLRADMEIPLADLHPRFFAYLDRLQPTGQANPEAVFVSRGLLVKHSKAIGSDGAHLRLTVTDGHITYDGIAFRQGARAANMPARIDVLYQFEQNEYNGKVSLQLNIRDFKPTGTPD